MPADRLLLRLIASGETLTDMQRTCLLVLLTLLCWLLPACGDVSLFIVSNPGVFTTTANQGTVILVVREAEKPSDQAISVTVVNGTVPPGLTLFAEGTLEGEPTETGLFEFTAHWDRVDGVIEEQEIHVNVTD